MAQSSSSNGQPHWSSFDETAINLEKLRLLCSSTDALKKEGYVTEPLHPAVILAKLRCRNCGGKMQQPNQATLSDGDTPERDTTDTFDANGQPEMKKIPRNQICEYHPGHVVNLHFTCCHAHVSIQKGCHTKIGHTAPGNYMHNLAVNWTYYPTPAPEVQNSEPPSNPSFRGRARFTNLTQKSIRSVIALDCEFGVSILNHTELIRITAIDFFTKQVLIDSLVKPNIAIKNYVTRYSGVTSGDMRHAVRTNQCIFGRDAARHRLLDFVDSETIIVVHGGSSDMSSLRMMHPRVLDTYILEKYCEAMDGGRSLKNLCKKKLGIDIQTGRGHDSQEDALACRELAILFCKSIPDE